MERLEAIVLAAGLGSRFGGGKLLAPYRGGALIHGAVRAALAAPVAKTILVTGYDGDDVSETAMALAVREYPGHTLEVVYAPHYREGMAASLRTGVTALSDNVEGAFVFLGDMPRIPFGVAARLTQSIAGRGAAAPVFQGDRGHPVLFAARLLPALMQLSADQGARAILDGLADDLALAEVDDSGVVFDVDHWSDLAS